MAAPVLVPPAISSWSRREIHITLRRTHMDRYARSLSDQAGPWLKQRFETWRGKFIFRVRAEPRAWYVDCMLWYTSQIIAWIHSTVSRELTAPEKKNKLGCWSYGAVGEIFFSCKQFFGQVWILSVYENLRAQTNLNCTSVLISGVTRSWTIEQFFKNRSYVFHKRLKTRLRDFDVIVSKMSIRVREVDENLPSTS